MSLALRKRETPSADVNSRLLPMLLGDKALEAAGHLRILDFGRANRFSLAFYSGLSCRLQVLDASDTLIGLTRQLQVNVESDSPETPVTPDTFETVFKEVGGQRFDLILLWDTINLVPARALPAFFSFISRHAHDGFRGHGFMLHKRNVECAMRHLGLMDAATLRVTGTDPTSLYLHTRKYVNEALAPMAIDHGVLHGDGRAEFLFRAALPGRGSGPGRA